MAFKTATTTASVLALPDFGQPVVVECDAWKHGFGAVLLQDQHLVAFFSRPVAPRHRSLAAYERELIGLVLVVRNWRPYLWGHRFLYALIISVSNFCSTSAITFLTKIDSRM